MAETPRDIIERFDSYQRIPSSGNVLIHLGLDYGFVEFTKEYVDELKKDIEAQLTSAIAGVDKLSPSAKFVIMILEKSF